MQTFRNVTFLKIMEDSAGQRLDNFLFKTLKGVPKSRIYRLIRKNEIRVNRSRASASTKLYLNDEVRLPPIRLSARESKYVDPLFDPETQIVFENNDLIVFNKPAGLAVHGGSSVKFGLIESLRASRKNNNSKEKSLKIMNKVKPLPFSFNLSLTSFFFIIKKLFVITALAPALKQSSKSETFEIPPEYIKCLFINCLA